MGEGAGCLLFTVAAGKHAGVKEEDGSRADRVNKARKVDRKITINQAHTI